MEEDAFYLPLSPADDGAERWSSTVHTTGPWDPGSQHGGPPSALLGRAVERCAPRDDVMVARMTVELLGAVPVGELQVRVRMARPGRSVELVEAALSAGGRDVAHARAWRVKRTHGAQVPDRHEAPPSRPESDRGFSLPPGWVDGYLSAMEWRFTTGSFSTSGPAVVWTRMRHALVPGEQPSGLQRALVVADSGNGLSAEVDVTGWYFINPELSLHLHREPVGPWLCVRAQTAVSPAGAGLATTVLADDDGPCGVGAQSLLVAPRR